MLGISRRLQFLPTLIYQQKWRGFGNDMLSQVGWGCRLIIACWCWPGMLLQQGYKQRKAVMALLGHTGQSDVRFVTAACVCNWKTSGLVLCFILVAAFVLWSSVRSCLLGHVADFRTPLPCLLYEMSAAKALLQERLKTVPSCLFLLLLVFDAQCPLPFGLFVMRLPMRTRAVIASLIEVPYAIPGIVLAIALFVVVPSHCFYRKVSCYGHVGDYFWALPFLLFEPCA